MTDELELRSFADIEIGTPTREADQENLGRIMAEALLRFPAPFTLTVVPVVTIPERPYEDRYFYVAARDATGKVWYYADYMLSGSLPYLADAMKGWGEEPPFEDGPYADPPAIPTVTFTPS